MCPHTTLECVLLGCNVTHITITMRRHSPTIRRCRVRGVKKVHSRVCVSVCGNMVLPYMLNNEEKVEANRRRSEILPTEEIRMEQISVGSPDLLVCLGTHRISIP